MGLSTRVQQTPCPDRPLSLPGTFWDPSQELHGRERRAIVWELHFASSTVQMQSYLVRPCRPTTMPSGFWNCMAWARKASKRWATAFSRGTSYSSFQRRHGSSSQACACHPGFLTLGKWIARAQQDPQTQMSRETQTVLETEEEKLQSPAGHPSQQRVLERKKKERQSPAGSPSRQKGRASLMRRLQATRTVPQTSGRSVDLAERMMRCSSMEIHRCP